MEGEKSTNPRLEAGMCASRHGQGSIEDAEEDFAALRDGSGMDVSVGEDEVCVEKETRSEWAVAEGGRVLCLLDAGRGEHGLSFRDKHVRARDQSRLTGEDFAA